MSAIGKKKLCEISAVLWLLWGMFHVYAGLLALSEVAPEVIFSIADAIEPRIMPFALAPLNAIMNQHGWNLMWLGLTTIIGSFFIWHQRMWAIAVCTWVGGMAEFGYFVFLKLGGYTNFFPGTLITLCSMPAIVCTLPQLMHSGRDCLQQRIKST